MSANVITMGSTKGGCGKSTICNAIASYLNYLGKKVLLIDLNSQMDLTLEFNLSKKQLKQSNVYYAFAHDAKNPQAPFSKDFKPAHIQKNLDILTASKQLSKVNYQLNQKNPTFAPYILSHVFSSKSGLGLQDKYDYILIDTHNDREVPIQNALVVSNYVLSPVVPSLFGINAVEATIEEFNFLKHKLLNPITRQSFITAKLRFIGNLIRFNTNTSNEFMKSIKNNSQFIAFIHELELFNKAQTARKSIFKCASDEYKQGKKNDLHTLNKRIVPELKKIVAVISKK